MATTAARWQKRGRIFDPAAAPGHISYAQVPTPFLMGDRIRIFYADRTPENKSFIAYVDVDRADPRRVIGIHAEPILEHGRRGTFDDEGMMPGDLVAWGGRWYLYYTGWNQGQTIPYRNSIGVAVSDDGGATFERVFEGPILDRYADEPYMAVTPVVVVAGDRLTMWYVSGTQWTEVDGRLEPVYVIKDAHSDDALHWTRPNRQCIEQRHPLEAHAHPSVIVRDGRYHMWFCFRDSHDFRDGRGSYRIGYGWSDDGARWTRDDAAAGIDVSPEGWDSAMLCYPYVIAFDGKLHMFYNGNGFGRTGIGYAVME